MTLQTRSEVLWSAGWSAAFLVVSRLSAVVAVPLVLHAVGSGLYAVWVMGGVLIMVQGLFDVGVGAALVRFVAMAAARNSRPAVLRTFRRALAFYLVISVLVSVPLLVWAQGLASMVSSLNALEETQAVTIIRFAAVAFVLASVTLALSSLLQGASRVDAAYRAQTLGWLVYIPALAIGLETGSSSRAIGLAWVCSYALQVVLLTFSGWRAIMGFATQDTPSPSLRQMVSLSGWWQLSSWADFLTFQLPRLAGGFVLSAGALVSLDVALRAAQLVVAPFFAVYPLIVPTATRAWTLTGTPALRAFVNRWFLGGAMALWLLTVAFLPIERPLLAAWTGRPLESFSLWLSVSVLVGVAAHASTGLFSSARLATGDISSVLRYKKQQLGLGLVLIPPALFLGATATGLALGIALAAPALVFDRTEVAAFRIRLPSRGSAATVRLVVATASALAILGVASSILVDDLPAWALVLTLLVLWVITCALAWFWCRATWVAHEPPLSETAPKARRVA